MPNYEVAWETWRDINETLTADLSDKLNEIDRLRSNGMLATSEYFMLLETTLNNAKALKERNNDIYNNAMGKVKNAYIESLKEGCKK